MVYCTYAHYTGAKRRRTMGDKGGKKNKEKSLKQKSMKHTHDVQQKKDKQPKNAFELKSSNFTSL
jgi:hypothetical protein